MEVSRQPMFGGGYGGEGGKVEGRWRSDETMPNIDLFIFLFVCFLLLIPSCSERTDVDRLITKSGGEVELHLCI